VISIEVVGLVARLLDYYRHPWSGGLRGALLGRSIEFPLPRSTGVRTCSSGGHATASFTVRNENLALKDRLKSWLASSWGGTTARAKCGCEMRLAT
jgi:hypothetical protein